MRHDLIRRLQHIFAFTSVMLVLAIVVLIGQTNDVIPAGLRIGALFESLLPAQPQIAVISGHAGYDSGAVCEDASGSPLITEATINADVAERVAQMLRRRGASVRILEEYDEQLEGLEVDVLISLHIDSCVDLSGFKTAHRLTSTIPTEESALVKCITHHYAERTGLSIHMDTITHDMTDYHVFRRISPTTPAAILEMGFLGGDQVLLTEQTEQVAEGIFDSLMCFLNGDERVEAVGEQP